MTRLVAVWSVCLLAAPLLAEKPWVALVHDAGLAGGPEDGLVFALWRDGTIVRQRSASPRANGSYRVGQIDTVALAAVAREIKDSGLWTRESAPQLLDLPEDGLVIREAGTAKCWFDTPPARLTPGLRRLSNLILELPVAKAVDTTLTQEQWLPWSHYHEECK